MNKKRQSNKKIDMKHWHEWILKPIPQHVPTSDISEKRVDETAKQRHEPLTCEDINE